MDIFVEGAAVLRVGLDIQSQYQWPTRGMNHTLKKINTELAHAHTAAASAADAFFQLVAAVGKHSAEKPVDSEFFEISDLSDVASR